MNLVCRLVFFSLLLLIALPGMAQEGVPGIDKVVIDPGHGGKDPGAVYRTVKEKDINLSVALQLGALINKHYPSVEVIYTRSTDLFIPLGERADKANKAGADLFISIHVNSAASTSARGTETFVMGMDKAGKNLEIAMKENDVVTYEEDYSTRYQGFVPGSAESYIMFSIMQYAFQTQSLNLARLVQDQYTDGMKLPNRGVKQGPFLVLWYASMPSILTELGFLSNETDRATLTSKKGQEGLARSLFNAFSAYKAEHEEEAKRITLALDQAATYVATEEEQTTKGGICYRIQLLSSTKKVPRNSSRFGRYRGEVKEIIIEGHYKYFLGEVATYQEAAALQKQVRAEIKDAFAVPFRGEVPITMQEARDSE